MSVTVNNLIELLDTEENRYGGATGKPRELNISINGNFCGGIESAKLDGYGDGLITDATSEIEAPKMKGYYEQEIRSKAISNFADWCYINGIDFSYMSTAKKSGRQFIDDVIARYCKEVDTSDYDKAIRNKAIDEFAEKFIYKAVCSGCSGCTNCYEEQRQCECEDWKPYMEIAEQMKEVGE